MKKVLLLLTVIFVVFALVACGGNNTDTPSSTDNDTSAESVTGDETLPDDTATAETDIYTISAPTYEISGNTLVATVKEANFTQTTEYIYDGDTLSAIRMSTEYIGEVSDADWAEAKAVYEEIGFTDIKNEKNKFSAYCPNVDGTTFEIFKSYSIENLKALLEDASSVAETMLGDGGGVVADYSISWEDISYLPDGMPKLADKVSSDYGNADSKIFSIGWNVLPREDFDEMIRILETWAGAPLVDFGSAGGSMYSTTIGNATIIITYSDVADTYLEQCTISGNVN